MDIPQIVGKGRIGNLISEHFVNSCKLDPEQEVEIELIDPAQLLVPERIDLICKLYYIDCLEKKRNIVFATEMYKEHIRAFSNGTFTEPGQESTKNSFEKYIDIFEELIDEIKTNGFDLTKSVVPIAENGAIIDGSHRTAIAIYYNIPIPVVRFDNVTCCYDYSFFQKRKMDSCYLDFMALEFTRRIDTVFVAFLWPSVSRNAKCADAETLIKACSTIIYKKQLKLSYHGLNQLMVQIYGSEKMGREH